MKLTIKIFFVFYFLLFACNEKKENRNIVFKVKKWNNGKIRSEGYFVHDTIKEGLFKRYYLSGKLESEATYKNNKLNGLVTKYFESGKKEFVIPYLDGIPTGDGEGYYEGGVIKFYQAYNRKGETTFQIDFLEDGGIKSVKGSPVVDSSFDKKNLRVGDTLKIFFIVAIPKNSKVNFHFYEDFVAKQGGQDLEVNEKDGTVRYQKVLEKKGTMNWGGVFLIKFGNGEKIKYEVQGVTTVNPS